MGFDLDPRVLSNKGQLFLFDFNHPEKDITKLKFSGKDFKIDTFNPHGVSVYEDKKSGKVSCLTLKFKALLISDT